MLVKGVTVAALVAIAALLYAPNATDYLMDVVGGALQSKEETSVKLRAERGVANGSQSTKGDTNTQGAGSEDVTFEKHVGYLGAGNDIATQKTYQQAVKACTKDPECGGFTRNTNNGQYFLKNMDVGRVVYQEEWETYVKKGSKLAKMQSTDYAMEKYLAALDATEPGIRERFKNFNVKASLENMRDNYPGAVLLHDDPIILQFDNFLSDDLCDTMIQWAHTSGLVRSYTAAGLTPDGRIKQVESAVRTSSTAWCTAESGCEVDPKVMELDERIANMTGTHVLNGEQYQLLHYALGQEYKGHSDFIDDHIKMPVGPRMFTMFLYLNTVEEGGETEFINLDLKVKPVKGRAILWPNVHYDRDEQHDKTMHRACPVIRGEKFSANKWIHRNDFHLAYKMGVSG